MTKGPTDFVILVGAMKCGTDSIFSYVTQHPAIAGSDPREPDFFADDERWEAGLDAYHDIWDWDPKHHAYAMEKSTSYTKRPALPHTVERMDQLREEVGVTFRFLYSIRNPLDRIESHATHEASARWGHPDPFSVRGMRGNWWTTSMYAKQIEPYVRCFGREAIHIINFEDLKEAPVEMTRRVWRFLGLDDDHPVRTVDPHRQSSIHEQKKHWGLDLAEKTGLAHLGKLLPERLRGSLNRALRTPVGEKVRLSDAQREFALHGLIEDLRILRDRYGADIDRWELDLPDTPSDDGESSTSLTGQGP